MVARKTLMPAWLGLILIAVVACGRRQEDVSLVYPLSRRFTMFGTREVFISAATDVPLSSLCDLSGFGELHPGVTLEGATRLLGAPTSHHLERHGRDEVYVFNLAGGKSVEVVKQVTGSEEPLVEQWVLRRDVLGLPVQRLVAPSVLAAVPPAQRAFTLHLNAKGAAAELEFDAGRPRWMWWLAEDGDDRSEN